MLEDNLLPSIVARLMATNVARRFRLAGKGDLIEGADADMTLLSTSSPHEIRSDDLFYRHRQSPYVSRTSRVTVLETWARGSTVFPKNPRSARQPAQILRPQPLCQLSLANPAPS